jgi:hypothetical protein
MSLFIWKLWHWPFWGWFFVNIGLPAVLPYFGIVFIRATGIRQRPTVERKLAFRTTVQDGQIGWLGLAWAAAAIYEGYGGLSQVSAGYFSPAAIGIVLVAQIVMVIMGIAVSAGGVVTACGDRRHTHYHAVTSICIAIVSGFLFCVIHTNFG